MVKLFTSKPKVMSSNLLRTKIKFLLLVFFTFFYQTSTFSKNNQNFSFWDDFLHTCHLIYLFYDYVKKIQKYFLLIIFSLSQKWDILSISKCFSKMFSFKHQNLNLFFKTSCEYTAPFKIIFKTFFKTFQQTYTPFSMIDSIWR